MKGQADPYGYRLDPQTVVIPATRTAPARNCPNKIQSVRSSVTLLIGRSGFPRFFQTPARIRTV